MPAVGFMSRFHFNSHVHLLSFEYHLHLSYTVHMAPLNDELQWRSTFVACLSCSYLHLVFTINENVTTETQYRIITFITVYHILLAYNSHNPYTLHVSYNSKENTFNVHCQELSKSLHLHLP